LRLPEGYDSPANYDQGPARQYWSRRQSLKECVVYHLPDNEYRGDVDTHDFAEFQRRQVQEGAISEDQNGAQEKQCEPDASEPSMVVEGNPNNGVAADF